MRMPESVVRVQKNKNITLPLWVMRRFHMSAKEWQEGELEAEEDIRKGRIKGFKGVKELLKDLRG